jgi:hypothetical protein
MAAFEPPSGTHIYEINSRFRVDSFACGSEQVWPGIYKSQLFRGEAFGAEDVNDILVIAC